MGIALDRPVFVLLLAALAVAALAQDPGEHLPPWYDTSLDFKDEPGENVALGKATTQSSFFNNGDDHSSSAVDGTLSHQEGCIQTAEESGAWWTVDLGADTEVKYVKIYNYVNLDQWWEHNLNDQSGGFTILTATVLPDSDEPGTFAPSQGYSHNGEVSQVRWMYGAVTIFRVDAVGRFLRVSKNWWGSLRLCEVQVFTTEPSMAYVVPGIVTNAAEAGAPTAVGCPEDPAHPLHHACHLYKTTGWPYEDNTEMALVKAMMEGPIQCGTGFFCRMKTDSYFSGTPKDQLYNNYNYGYCRDANIEEPDNNFPGNFRAPARDDGHCHGSHIDSVYQAVIEDHYFRNYRGTLECCCGESEIPRNGVDGLPIEQNGWVPATNFIHRCDFRGKDGNNGNYNFNNGCGGDAAGGYYVDPSEFVDPETYKENNAGKCWEMKHFGKQPEFFHGANPMRTTTVTPLESPSYPVPAVTILHCTGDAVDWEGCLLYVEGRPTSQLVVFVSSSLSEEPRTLKHLDVWNDKAHACAHVENIHVGNDNLRFFHFRELDTDGQEAGYVKIAPDFAPGMPVHIQVFDTETCAMSDVKSSTLEKSATPSATTGNRRMMS